MFIPMYKKGRALNFGKKYPGIKIETVIAKDPEYVVWCLEHVDHFDLDNELYSLLENELRANEHRRNQEYWTQLRDTLSRNESREEPRIRGTDVSVPVTITFDSGARWVTATGDSSELQNISEVTNPELSQRIQDMFNRDISQYVREWREEVWGSLSEDE